MNGPKDGNKTFVKCMKIWNNLLSGLGLSPVGLYHTERGELTVRVSVWRMVVIAFMSVVSIVTAMLQTSQKKFDFFSLGRALIAGYINFTGCVVMTFFTVSVMWNSSSYASLVLMFLRFNRHNVQVRSQAVFLDFLKFISGYAAIMIVCFCLDCFIYFRSEEVLPIRFLLSYIPGLYGLLTIWHFAACCFYLRECLWNINRNVEKHERVFAPRAPLPGVEFLKINTVFPEYLESLEPEVNANALWNVRRLYHRVYIMSGRLNAVFGTRNLLTVAHNFALGTTLMYCGLNEMFKYQNNNSNFSVFDIVNYFKWSATCFFFIYGIIWPCTRVYAEMQNTIILVQHLFTKSPEGELQAELHGFVMQLFHEKIIFSPHGFFVLDHQLVLSIIGSAASYLVILIQFRIMLV